MARTKGTPTIGVRVRARALIEAERATDAEVATKYGIAQRTIVGWRRDLETDPELAAAYAELRSELDREWRSTLTRTMVEGCERLRALLPMIGAEDVRAVIAIVETCGEILVTGDALAPSASGKGPGGKPPRGREGAASTADPHGSRPHAIQ